MLDSPTIAFAAKWYLIPLRGGRSSTEIYVEEAVDKKEKCLIELLGYIGTGKEENNSHPKAW